MDARQRATQATRILLEEDNPGDAGTVCVLLVEDDDGDALLAREMLAEARAARPELPPCRLEHATRLGCALARLERGGVDLVLLDISLPDCLALECFDAVRAAAPHLPVVILTGLEDGAAALAALQAGAQDYLVKGELTSLAVGRTVAYALERHRWTERLLARERELHGAAERERVLISGNADAILTVDRDGTVLFANPSAERMFGVPPGGLARAPFSVPRAGGGSVELELESGPDQRTVEMRAAPITWEGAPAHLVSLRDITERKQAEQALRVSERRYRRLVESLNEVVWSSCADGSGVLEVNPAFERVYGRPLAELLANPAVWLEAVHPEDRAIAERSSRELMEQGRSEAVYRIVRPDGEVRWLHDRKSLIRDEEGRVVQLGGVAADVTESRLLQEQLLQAQKMEALGRLAGGVAHDFNNILQAMLATAQLLGSRAGGNEAMATAAEELEQLVQRATGLVRQLLLFSRRETGSREVLDLQSVVADLTTMLRRLVREDISLVVRAEGGPFPVKADRGQLEQALTNLVVNAADAIAGAGEIRITTCGADGHSWFEVRDTGGGIPEEIRARIFDPFFSTKETGRGSGLGLSVVHGIITQHGGSIEVDSEVGNGSTFRVVLPNAAEPVAAAPVREAGAAPPGRGERILVVEDSEPVRRLFARALEAHGYRVTAAPDPAVAMALANENSFELLLTDMVMPGGSGAALADQLLERWPDLRVIVVSGYAEEEELERLRTRCPVRFLLKPVEIATLAREVRAALAAPGREAG